MMPCEIIHGPAPHFHVAANMRESFSCTVVGHYSPEPLMAAAGVTEHHWQPARPIKRAAELAVLYAAFMDWYYTMQVEINKP